MVQCSKHTKGFGHLFYSQERQVIHGSVSLHNLLDKGSNFLSCNQGMIPSGKKRMTKTNTMPKIPVWRKINLDQSSSETRVRKMAAKTGPNTVPPPPKKSINIACKVISTEKADSGVIKKVNTPIIPPTTPA